MTAARTAGAAAVCQVNTIIIIIIIVIIITIDIATVVVVVMVIIYIIIIIINCPGARFSKLPVITGLVKLFCISFQMRVSKSLKIVQ